MSCNKVPNNKIVAKQKMKKKKNLVTLLLTNENKRPPLEACYLSEVWSFLGLVDGKLGEEAS